MALKEPKIVQYAIPHNRPTQYEEYPGDIVSPMPRGYYLQVRREGHTHTANEACVDLWHLINQKAQSLSAAAYSQTPTVGQDLIGNVIDAINVVFAATVDRLVTGANSMYSSTFGGPLPHEFVLWPIRWPAESPEALKNVLKFVEAAYQVPQVKCNTADWGVPSNHAGIIMKPLYFAKALIMKTWFGIETKGDISPAELDSIFRNSNLRPPLGSSFDDVSDSRADTASEDAAAMTNESASKPNEETTEAAQAGIDVWTWVPDAGSWITFAGIKQRREKDGPNQNPVLPFPFNDAEQQGDEPQDGAAPGLVPQT